MTVLALIGGGSLGTLARYYGVRAFASWWGSAVAGIFAVNIAGAFAIGLLLTLAQERFRWHEDWRVFIAAGFLGAFTTFSTLAWDTYRSLTARDVAAAALNIAGTVILGLLAVWAGATLARLTT